MAFTISESRNVSSIIFPTRFDWFVQQNLFNYCLFFHEYLKNTFATVAASLQCTLGAGRVKSFFGLHDDFA